VIAVKKVLPLIIGFALFLSFPSTALSNVANVDDSITYPLTEIFEIKHEVRPINSFDVDPLQIPDFTTGINTGVDIADVSVENNTRDGYKLTLQTTYGALHSDTSMDGEVDIPYRFSYTDSINDTPGTAANAQGAGEIFTPLTIPVIPPTEETLILGVNDTLSGDGLLNKPTKVFFTLRMKLVSNDFVEMAGTYTDTITIRYTDL
jgi:hypothetical protein